MSVESVKDYGSSLCFKPKELAIEKTRSVGSNTFCVENGMDVEKTA